MPPETLEACFEQYINRVQMKSAHTLAAYKRAADLFLSFARETKLPQNPKRLDNPEILAQFVDWLMVGQHRYALATVELRLAGVQHWFQFMEDEGWLAEGFMTIQASRIARQKLIPQHQDNEKAVNPVTDLQAVIFYYDTQQPTATMLKKAESYARWEQVRLRNRALLHCMAETGGRVSELLGLNVENFAQSTFSGEYAIQVEGKGGHPYSLVLKSCLPMIRDYLKHRDALPISPSSGSTPLFISHDQRYRGSRMSRIVAWRVVHRAANALGMGEVSPHDFRHWRASQLIRDGYNLYQIQDFLGHRSIETVRALYAHLFERQDDCEG
ncbi:MAG: tyrosine-type recombinase/integrase [Anaerolineales bacterium]|nr:tyrosine-type recombinase/integrase [Anaerolineales bacterium]